MKQTADPITCNDVREGLTEYLDEALPPTRRQGFEAHLDSCTGCRQLLGQTGATREELAALPREPMPPEMKQTLLRAFRSRQSA